MSSWLNEAIIYQIFIDRFSGFTNTDNWQKPVHVGGNIRGIIEKLPYIKSLGVNTVWLSPFYESGTYHGYSITDFYDVDPHFGTEKDLKELIDKAHSRSIKVISDFVPNHCSDLHPYFVDAKSKINSEYKDWFIFDKWPNEYRMFLSIRTLPKLNLDNPDTMAHIVGSAQKWLKLGLDGFRIDHIIGLSNQNVDNFLQPLRKEFPEAVFFGEAWDLGITLKEFKTVRVPHKHILWAARKLGKPAHNSLYKNYIGLLDGVLDFEVASLLDHYVNSKNKWVRKYLEAKVKRKAALHQGDLLKLSFLDNHDVERFLFKCKNDVNRLKAAAGLQFQLNQPPIIYYGTEIGMTQRESFDSVSTKTGIDILALAREPMKWDESDQNMELLSFYKQLIVDKKK